VIKVLMMVALSLAGGLLFVGLAENDVTGWMVFGILFSALVLHCVIEVIYSYEFRKVLSHKGTLFASLAAALLIAFAFRFDWFRYDTSIPAMDRLESISVYINGLETGIYYSGEFEDAVEYGLEKGKMEEVEPGYQIAQTGVQNEKENLWENMDQNGDSDITPVDVTVAYYLKNGREKVRYYRMTQEQIDRYLPALYEEEGFKKGLNSVLGIDAERVKFDGVQMYDTYHSGRINLSPEDIAKLLQTCQQEMLEASYEEMQPEKMWGNLQFSKTGSMEDASVTVYDSFDQTLKLLEDLGYPMEKVPDIKEVSQITVYNYEPEWYLENGEVYEDPSVIFEDEKDIKEILSKVVLAEAPYFEVDSDYNVEVIVNSQDGLQSNYMQLNYQFKKNEIPSCVLEAFQNLKENQD
jgi:ABC-2 type transport system permease protein